MSDKLKDETSQVPTLSDTQRHNVELASRLRGLAEIVEQAAKPVRLRLGVRAVMPDGSKFESQVGDFRAVSTRMGQWAIDRSIENLKTQSDPEAQRLIAVLEQLRSAL